MKRAIYDFFSNEIDSNGDYYNIGTFEQFDEDMQDPQARRDFYDFFSNEVDENGDYYNLGTFAEFEQDIARSTAKEIGKASAQATGKATGKAIKEQPQVARPVTAVQASDRGPFYTTKAFGDWLNGQPNPQMVEQTKAINQAQASGQVTETPTAPSAPKAEDITTTKATATTAEVPKVETTANPVSALHKADGTPYSAEELQATADKQQAESTAQVAEQPTVQSSAEIEAEIDEKIANQGYLSSASYEADKARLEDAKAKEAEGDQKAEDGESDFVSTLQGLYGKKDSTPSELKTYTANYQLPIDLPTNFDDEYYSRYGEDASRVIFSYAKAKAVEDNGGNPLSDMQLIDLNNRLSRMSEDDVAKLIGEEGMNKLMNLAEKYKSASRDDAVTYGAVDKLFAMPGMSEQISNILLYPGGSGEDEATVKEWLKGDVTAFTLASQNDYQGLANYINAKVLGVEQYFGKGALDYYMQNPDTNKDTKSDAILNYANTIKQAIGKVNLPQSAEGYLVRNAQDMAKRGQIGTTDGDARMNDMLNRLQTYPQLFGQLSEDAKKVVLNRLNYVLPTAKISSLEDAMWGDTTIYNALVGEITKYFQQLGAVEDFDSKRSEAEEKYKEMIEDAGSTFQGNPYAPGWVNVKNWADHTVDQIPDAREWSVAIDMNDDTADILNNSAKSGFGGFFQGLADGTFDLSTWDFGFSDTQKNLAIKNVLTKLDNDEPLTEGETALADAIVSNLAAQALVSPSMAYKVGNGVAVSIPYLLEMTLPVLGVGKGVARKLYTFALKREAKGALKKIAKTISKAIGTGVESVARTVLYGGGKVGANVINRTTGEADVQRDENGELKVVGTKKGTKESLGKAITKSFLSQATTYFVERVGGDIFSFVNIPLTKGKDFVMNKIGGEFTPNEIWDGFVKRTGWQGTPSEFFEEILDQVAQATIEGEGFDKIATVDNLLTTAYTTLALGTMLKAPNAIGYKSESKRLEAQIEDLSAMGEIALGKEWEGIQSRIDNATFGEIQGVLSDIAKDKKLTPEQKRIAINYGLNVGVNKEIIDRKEKGQLYDKDNESIKAQETIINAMEQGANITDVNEGYNTQIREDITGESLARMVGVESISEAKDVIAQRYGTDSPMEIAIEVANDASLNDKQRKVILDYYTALATNQGKQTALEQKRDINKQTADAVSAKANKDMGKQVVTATRKVDGAQVTIIAGNIVTNEGGSINKEKSDDAIVSVDADGNKEMISLGNISNIATQSKEDAELEERAKLTQELEKAENVSNGRVSVGDVIDYGFYDGNTNAKSRKVVVTDVTTDADGNRMVTFVEQELNGAEPVTMTEKELEVGRGIAYFANNSYQLYNGPVGLPSATAQATQAETTQEQSTFKGDAPTETEQVVESTAPQQEQAPTTQVAEQAPQVESAEVVEESTEQPMVIEPGVSVSLADGSIGEVVSMPEDGRVIVEHEDGSTNEYNVGDLKVAEKPSAQTSQAPQAPTAPQVESTPAVEQTTESAQQVESTATPTAQVEIPTDEKGKKVYEQAPIEATINDIYNDPELDEEEADAYVQAKVDGATKRIKVIDKKKPKMGEDRDAYVAQRDAWRAERNAEQAKLDYWQGVQAQRAQGKANTPKSSLRTNEPTGATPSAKVSSAPSPKMDTPKAEPTAPPMESKPKAKPIKVGTKRNSKGQVIGLIDSPLAQVLNNTTRRILNKLGESLGVSIHIVPHLEGANAKIEGDRITVAVDAEQGPLKALGHELLHRIKSLSPKAYEDFADVVEKIVPSFQARMVATRLVYSNAGRKIDMKLLREEVVADLAGDVMYHAGLMQKFVEVLRPKTTKEVIMDTMRDLYARIRGVFEGEGARNFAKAERVLLDAMKKANKVVAQDETTEADNASEKLSIIGESGASALDQAEEATIRMDNLAKARKMERFDYPTKSIRMATGWERGADGKWRYEIDDVKLKKTTYENTETTLGELVDNAELFSAYPSLMDLKVVFTDTPNNTLGRTYSQYAEDENGQGAWIPTQISLNNLLVWDDAETESVLAHEIQHAIQSMEGFARGSSVETSEQFIKENEKKALIWSFRKNIAHMAKANPGLSPEELIEKAVARRVELTGDDVATLEAQGEIPNEEGRIKAYNLWARGYDNEGYEDAYNMALGDNAYEIYRREAGEVEARNVQSRIGMTPDQRRATLLAETEDVAREDQIFLVENSGVSAMGSTVVKRKADIAVKLQGKDISPTQLKVVDAFTTDVNNIAIDVVDANGKQRNITLKQGQDNRAGVKHSVLKHYETASNSYSAEDILLIPQIIEQGERKQDGKKVSYKLGINGVTYSVTTEINNRGAEVFTNFYTNRSGNARSSNTQLSAQADSTTTSTDKGSDNIGDVQGLEDYSAEEIKEIAREYIEDVIAENGFDADVVDLAIYGSRRRGDARDDSDLDIVVEYSGNVSEDGLFNALNDAETQLEINGVKVDINPITKGKSGSLNEFMKRAEEYDNDTKYSLRSNSQEVADIVAKAKADGTYMKAPNGESTNLTEEQWANVRTKAFKDWFGDWELVANIKSGLNALMRIAEGEESIPNAMRRDELRALGGTAEITFDWGAYGKLDKSGTPRGGFGFAKIIQKHGYDEAFRIIETIAKGELGKPYGVEGGTRVDIVSGDYQTTISLYRNGKSESWVLTGYKIDYNTDAKGRGNDLSKATQIYPTPTREDLGAALKSNANVQYFNEITNNSSKIVDENGEPKVVYHQTNRTIYRNIETGENWDDLDWRERQEWEERDDWDEYWEEEDFYAFNRKNARTTNEFDGFFFAPKYDEYHEYGDRTIEVFLNIRKPASREDYHIDAQYNDAGRKERIKLQEEGYDGVIREEDGVVDEYVAFEPNQIKSATDNVGTYSSEDNDTRYSLRGNSQEVADIMDEFTLSQANQDDFSYALMEMIAGQKHSANPFYKKLGDVWIRVKEHSPNWSNFVNWETGDAVAPKILNVTIGDYDNTDYRRFKQEYDSFVEEHPETTAVNVVIEDGTSLSDSISLIHEALKEKGIDFEFAPNYTWVKYYKNEGDDIRYSLRGDVGSTESALDAMKDDNPKGWESIKNKLRGTPIWEEVAKDANYTDDDAITKEALSRLKVGIDDLTQEMTDNAKGVFEKAEAVAMADRMRRALNEFDAWVEQQVAEPTDGEGVKYSLRVGGVLHPQGDDYDGTRKKYNDKVKSFGYKMREGYQDSMLALKELQKIVAKANGKKVEDIPSWQNAYINENLMSSKNKAQHDAYVRDYYKPLINVVKKLIKKGGMKYDDIKRYLIAKHGLERNEKMAVQEAKKVADNAIYKREQDAKNWARIKANQAVEGVDFVDDVARNEAWKQVFDDVYTREAFSSEEEKQATWDEVFNKQMKQNRNRDYSGLTAMFGVENVHEAEKMARELVDKVEQPTGKMDELWNAIRSATEETLATQYKAGLLSRDEFEKIRDMYEYYVPLRGFDEKTADEEYEYLVSKKPILQAMNAKAMGRSSLADDPLATIGAMADSAIIQSNRNKMKQAFYHFVKNNPSALVTESEQWYVQDGEGHWVATQPDIPANATSADIEEAIAEHEERMEALKREGKARTKPNILDTNFITLPGQAVEHMVKLKINGKEKVLYINGNPRAAQAVNGLTNPEAFNDVIRDFGKVVNNYMAQVFTSKNPAFIFTNGARDLQWAANAVMMKEGWKYQKQYAKNIVKASQVAKYILKYNNGTLNLDNETQRYFNEFISSGGETGYTAINQLDHYKKEIAKMIKGVSKVNPMTAVNGVLDSIEYLNRSVEDITRFAVFMTSRQMGRSLQQSAYDAKEITVNFNKKGSGIMGARYFGAFYIFLNASLQSINNLCRIVKHHPIKATIKFAEIGAVAYALPMLNELLIEAWGDDDDKEAYANLPEWVKKNNVVLYIPGTDGMFFTIPMSHEMRPFATIGYVANKVMNEGYDAKEGMKDIISAFGDMLPIEITGNDGNMAVNLTPTFLQPIAQLVANTDYFGKPIYRDADYTELKPEYTTAFRGTSPILIDASKYINEISGGDAGVKGKADGIITNPDVLEHLIESYFGGLGKLVNKSVKSISAIWDEQLREVRNIPVVSSFVAGSEERTSTGFKQSEEYYALIDEYKKYESKRSSYKEEVLKGARPNATTEERMNSLEYANKLTELMSSPEAKRYITIKGYKNYVDALNKGLENVDITRRADVEKMLNELKKELISEVDKAENKDVKELTKRNEKFKNDAKKILKDADPNTGLAQDESYLTNSQMVKDLNEAVSENNTEAFRKWVDKFIKDKHK